MMSTQTLLFILLCSSITANGVLVYLLVSFIKRLLQYDDLYQYLFDDVETNLSQFERIRKSSLLSDDDEVRNAHRNMVTMAMRMDEFANRMEEMTGKKMRKTTKPMNPINVTKEADKIING